MQPELFEALKVLLTKVSEKTPGLTGEEKITVSAKMIEWMAHSLDGIPEFRDTVEGIEYDKIEQYWNDRKALENTRY